MTGIFHGTGHPASQGLGSVRRADRPLIPSSGMTDYVFEDHLSLDAVVALADGELSLRALTRACAHLARCDACADEVAEQEAVRGRLRSLACPPMPFRLQEALRTIPLALPLPSDHPTGRRG